MASSFDNDVMKAIYSNKECQKEVKKYVKEQFNIKKTTLLVNFSTHPITQEVGNPNSSNISNTLGGYGNLYGFLGLESADPISPVRKVLNDLTILEKVLMDKDNGKISIQFKVPELNDFDEVAKLEWDPKNWVKGIERGLSGFQNFMAKAAGRSGKGIQIKEKVKPFVGGVNKFQNTKYMSSLINEFKKSIKQI
jgi:hypothetical protein